MTMTMTTTANSIAVGEPHPEAPVPVPPPDAPETTAGSAAELSRALIQSSYTIAKQFPRDMMAVRRRILTRCEYPRFAEIAIYKKPQGRNKDGSQNYIKGLSIRFAEAAAQAYGNILTDVVCTFDSPTQRTLQVTTIDLETNAIVRMPVTFEKTVERRSLPRGMKPLALRTNAYGDPVHIVEATDDEIITRQNALVSKVRRNNILQLIPGELLDEAREVIAETAAAQAKADPGATLRRMVDAYHGAGVDHAMLADYLGHSLDLVTAEEIDDLRTLWAALADKETTFKEALAQRKTVDAEAPAAPPVEALAPGDAVAEKMAARKRS